MPTDPPEPEAEPNIILVMAALLAAQWVANFDSREFQGMRSPRYVSTIHRAVTVARDFYAESRRVRR